MHCKLATLSRRQKPMLPGRRYRSMSPAGRQSLQFYNEVIKWWPSANNFQCCPRAFGPRATLEIIGFGSPFDKASLLVTNFSGFNGKKGGRWTSNSISLTELGDLEDPTRIKIGLRKPGITRYRYLKRWFYICGWRDLIFDRDSSERNDLLRQGRNVHGSRSQHNYV